MVPSFFLRLVVTVCSTLALWLSTVSPADAAPVAKRHARVARAMWESRPAPRRARARAAVERSRPRAVHYLSLLRQHRLVPHPPTTWLERRHTTPFRDNSDEALPNSTAALGGQDDLLLASLEPIGVLAAQRCRIPINGVIAPRSPRGPPTSPA
jgi:hypothetical protein